MAMPAEVDPPATEQPFPWRPPFTVDTLFAMPDDGLRYEVLGGSLVVSPQPTPEHNRVADRLCQAFNAALPTTVEAITTVAVRLPTGDGPVPDLVVTSADPGEHPRGIPAELVHTVVEVVSPSNAADDRVRKAALYAAAGIPCYWRVELRPWREHFGPVPAVVVRLLGDDAGWHDTLAAAGTPTRLPVALDRAGGLAAVELDPATLVGRRA